MTLDADKKAKVENYINEQEQKQGYGNIAETVADLAGLEKETKENLIFKWLKNDKDLLNYAELFNKKENLNIGENIQFKLLEVKLNITCPYFADFKDFLTELQRGPDTSSQDNTTPETSENPTHETPTTNYNNNTHKPSKERIESDNLGNHIFYGTNVNNIESEPYDKNSKTGVTWCSKTARLNGENFGLELPSGPDAYTAGTNPGRDSIQTIPQDKINKRPSKSRDGISASQFKSINKGNYADIYTNSKSNYGHRAAAFRDDNGQRYVLDPYTRVNGKLDNSPKKLEDYLNERKIVKAHIYKSKTYKKSN